jgi:hypothetical protein
MKQNKMVWSALEEIRADKKWKRKYLGMKEEIGDFRPPTPVEGVEERNMVWSTLEEIRADKKWKRKYLGMKEEIGDFRPPTPFEGVSPLEERIMVSRVSRTESVQLFSLHGLFHVALNKLLLLRPRPAARLLVKWERGTRATRSTAMSGCLRSNVFA